MEPYRSIGQTAASLYSSGPYVYDGAGNISVIGPSSYHYDAANRLVEAVEFDNEHSTFYTLGWAYDAFGNMIRSSQAVGNGASAFREYCPTGNPGCTLQNNRLSQISFGGLTGNVSYDERGNMTADLFRQYIYDLRNRLIEHRYSQPSSLAGYTYDANGNRLVKTANGATTYYVRDQQGQVLSEFRQSSASETPAWHRDYLYAAGRLVGEAENDKPQPPTNLTLVTDIDEGIVTLTWTPPQDPDLQKYYLYRTENSAHPTTTQLTIYTTTYQDHPANINYRYDYYLKAVDTAGNESESSGTVKVKLGDIDPPSNPSGLNRNAGDTKVSLSWTGSTDNVQVLGYEIRRNYVIIREAAVQSTTSFVDLGLTNGTTYNYEVYARDTKGNYSVLPATGSATPLNQVPPDPPTGLTATTGCTGSGTDPETRTVYLSWNSNAAEDGVDYYTLSRNGTSLTPTIPASGPLVYPDILPLGTIQATYTLTATNTGTPASQPSQAVIIQLRLLDGSLVATTSPLVARGDDGRVTVEWDGPVCPALPCKSFVVYRKLNMQRGCTSFERVGAFALAHVAGTTIPYSFTDYSVENATAYDYAVTLMDTSGREGGFSSLATGVPLETIKDVRRCRGNGNAICPANTCPEFAINCYPWVYRWNIPSTPAYQPSTAWPSSQGYLKGYHIYNYDPNSSGSLSQIGVNSGNFDYGLLEGKDGEYSETNPEYSRCKVVTGVYKVFVDGNWLSMESGPSSNFYPEGGTGNQKCPSMQLLMDINHWCSVPTCSELNEPPAPPSVTATPGPNANQITVTWTVPTAGGEIYPDIIGYDLYVDDPLYDSWSGERYSGNRSLAAFRKNHPYLRLDSNTTSVVLDGLRPCRTYAFYVRTVGGSGRSSEPSSDKPQASAKPSLAGEPTAQGDLRVRLWTGNDAHFASTDSSTASTASTNVVRLVRDNACASSILQQSTDLVNWTDIPSETLNCNYADGASTYLCELTFAPPMGVTTYFRLKTVSNGLAYSNIVATEVLPHDVPPLSPPSHFDARFFAGITALGTVDTVKMRWCPSFLEGNLADYRYRIFRYTSPGGPYTASTRITNPDLPATQLTYNDVYNASTNSIDPEAKRYYYVIAAVHVVGGVETISALSQEDGAGLFNGSSSWDPDSAEWGTLGSEWINNSPPTLKERLQFCDDDYVESRPPEFVNPLKPDGANASVEQDYAEANRVRIWEISENSGAGNAAPYRTVGVVVPFHYTYYHLDHLGSPRILTDGLGVRVQGQHFLPFGEEMPIEPGINTRKFTGHERDYETGLDYMVARYYQANLGRFMAVDPGDDTDPEDPQSWNKYAYVRNNPILKNDPTGNCGQMNPNNSGECKINPDPDGDGKNNITFANNVAGAASPDQFVTVDTANMVEGAVVSSGVDSVNISSTTGRAGAKPDPNSNHPKGKAVDIDKVNGKPVDQSKAGAANPKDVAKVQDAFAKQPNIRENYGPARGEKTSKPGGKPVPLNPNNKRDKTLINDHKNHIHVSGQK
jgi:RHS repeat-associated core domain